MAQRDGGPYEAPVKPRAPAKRKPPAAAPGAQPSTDLFDAESEGEEPSCKRQRQDDGQASQESEPGNATSASPAKKKPRKKPTSDVLDMAEAAFDDIMADDSDDEDSGGSSSGDSGDEYSGGSDDDSDSESGSDDGSDTPCVKCGSASDAKNILLCDKCEAHYHLGCLMPPLKRVPQGDWFCPKCAPAKRKVKKGNGQSTSSRAQEHKACLVAHPDQSRDPTPPCTHEAIPAVSHKSQSSDDDAAQGDALVEVNSSSPSNVLNSTGQSCHKASAVQAPTRPGLLPSSLSQPGNGLKKLEAFKWKAPGKKAAKLPSAGELPQQPEPQASPPSAPQPQSPAKPESAPQPESPPQPPSPPQLQSPAKPQSPPQPQPDESPEASPDKSPPEADGGLCPPALTADTPVKAPGPAPEAAPAVVTPVKPVVKPSADVSEAEAEGQVPVKTITSSPKDNVHSFFAQFACKPKPIRRR